MKQINKLKKYVGLIAVKENSQTPWNNKAV